LHLADYIFLTLLKFLDMVLQVRINLYVIGLRSMADRK